MAVAAERRLDSVNPWTLDVVGSARATRDELWRHRDGAIDVARRYLAGP
jgi:hypothetical protein